MQDMDRIVIDPKILVGKPVIRGTRIAMEFIIELLSEGWIVSQILENYPHLKSEDVQACLSYACRMMKLEKVYPIPA